MSATNALPPGGPSNAPQALLWSYELNRENKTLIEDIHAVKEQLLAIEEHSRNLGQYLKSLTNFVNTLDRTKGSNYINTEEGLLHLGQQLKGTVLPLCDSDQSLVDKNKALVKCITELETICNKTSTPTDASTLQHASVTTEPDHGPHAQTFMHSPGSLPIVIVHGPPHSEQRPSWLHMETTMTLETMKQEDRSLELYYDEANYLRRQMRPTVAQDEILVKTFIEGCDDRLSRRRLTHAVRNGNMTWTRLGHEVQHLLNEEEYMENQKYALAHRNGNGSVMWPDGSVKHRFIAWLPFTESDLTTSEEDMSSSDEDSKAKSI
ncbi:uncharacterized protein N7498_006982 [Penicillium cinerascens]|uniref:Uncharacterized protein n=1 Tax=Penicillium cinerascens TaxID=70096 RepID=A0A9W9JMV5_9EURO|nr:uncharacterized protein N7498_006982 [Penicillium cinerascens]KAJ5197865.1 hypothetical protein N7498_006982 [Penicillium cinerascens]